MATVRTLITAALRRARVLGEGEAPQAAEAADALAALNGMMHGWAGEGVDVQHQELALGDEFRLFQPPKGITGRTLALLAYQATWNATTNSPALTSSAGTEGHLYRVATAGSTSLDGNAAWAVGDHLVFDGTAWLRAPLSRRFEDGVADMLAVKLSAEYGKDPRPATLMGADACWSGILAAYIVADDAVFDSALIRMPSRGFHLGNA